jgi:hypothetical protein
MYGVLLEAQVDANWRRDMCAIENVDNPVAADGIAVPIGIVMPLIAGLKDESGKNLTKCVKYVYYQSLMSLNIDIVDHVDHIFDFSRGGKLEVKSKSFDLVFQAFGAVDLSPSI